MSAKYIVTKKSHLPKNQAEYQWDSEYFAPVPELKIKHFHPESSNHHPTTSAKMVHTGNNICLIFKIDDQYIRSVHQGHNASVCQDSCVEFFAKPKPETGYVSFEANAGGHLLSYFIENHARTPNGFEKYTKSTPEQASVVKVVTSLPETVDPEISEPKTWYSMITIPVEYFENFIPELGNLSGQTWKVNFFKCGDQTSHPHWGSWAPIGEQLNYHQPDKFEEITFE